MDVSNQDFIALCRNYSDAVDLIQAGGGNASTKYLDSAENRTLMMIKASGYLMTEVDEKHGYSIMDLNKVLVLIEDVSSGLIAVNDEETQNSKINEANISTLRPSIETYLHALLPQKHVLHLHSLAALRFASTLAFNQIMALQFKFKSESVSEYESESDFEFSNLSGMLLVGYEKPGIKLALELKYKLEEYKAIYHQMPDVIVLQNHGIILAGDNLETIDQLAKKSETELLRLMALPNTFSAEYRKILEIKKAISISFDALNLVVRLNEDRDLIRLRSIKLSFPDAVVFCGPEIIISNDFENLSEEIKSFYERYDDFPKVIIYQDNLYFVATSIKKCLEIQDVLKIQFLLNEQLGEDLQTLDERQIAELLNWEAEKYRKKL